MKKTLSLVFSSCDYYDDELISVVYDAPNEDGIISYEAGISTKQNSARLNKLEYQIEKAENNKITIKIPETVKSNSGTEYKIEEFGGSTGSNAPLQRFLLIININEDLIENKPKLEKMSEAARKSAISDANERIYKVVMDLYNKK